MFDVAVLEMRLRDKMRDGGGHEVRGRGNGDNRGQRLGIDCRGCGQWTIICQ